MSGYCIGVGRFGMVRRRSPSSCLFKFKTAIALDFESAIAAFRFD
ncbi:MAG: hypothetical protein ACRC6M_16970 [Microcystaceae cyanobacterium]